MNCAGHPAPHWWDHDIDGEHPTHRAQRHAAAQAICRPCPARLPCLEAGRNGGEGIWGGTNIGTQAAAKVRASRLRRGAR